MASDSRHLELACDETDYLTVLECFWLSEWMGKETDARRCASHIGQLPGGTGLDVISSTNHHPILFRLSGTCLSSPRTLHLHSPSVFRSHFTTNHWIHELVQHSNVGNYNQQRVECASCTRPATTSASLFQGIWGNRVICKLIYLCSTASWATRDATCGREGESE